MSETLDTGTQTETAIATDANTTPSETVEAQSTEPTAKPANTEKADAPKARPWFENRIAEEAHKAREYKRQYEALQAQVLRQQPSNQQQQAPTNAGMVPVAEVERRVEMRASQIASEQAFVASCNAVADAGTAKYADFGDAVKTFGMLGDIPPTFLEAIADLGRDDGAKVYYDLGKNPDEAARILGLPPAKMAMALAKMATATPPAKPVSKAPAPITPLSGNATTRSDAEPDGKDLKQWAAWFNKQRNRS